MEHRTPHWGALGVTTDRAAAGRTRSTGLCRNPGPPGELMSRTVHSRHSKSASPAARSTTAKRSAATSSTTSGASARASTPTTAAVVGVDALAEAPLVVDDVAADLFAVVERAAGDADFECREWTVRDISSPGGPGFRQSPVDLVRPAAARSVVTPNAPQCGVRCSIHAPTTALNGGAARRSAYSTHR